jgi:hypothetical protein
MNSIALLCLVLCQQPAWHAVTPDVDLNPWAANQIWAHCYGGSDGLVWVVWSSSGEVYAQGRDIDTLTPVTGLVHVNTTTTMQQDEPQVVRLADGRVVVAWSDRSSLWTQYMSAQYSVLSPNGTVLVPETPLWSLAASAETSWAPVLDATRDGGFVAAWTGGWNEYSYARVFGSDLQPLGPEFRVHEDDGTKHDSPDICEIRTGEFVAVHMDGGVPAPKDITAWWLTPAGQLTANRSTNPQVGQQWYPHIASDLRGIVVSVWDGDPAQDIYLRRWSYTGRPLGQVETLTGGSGSHRDAEVAMSDRKGGLAVWEDVGNNVISVQQISSLGASVGAPFNANAHALGAQFPGEAGRRVPDVWIAPDGRTAVVCWTSASSNGTDQDSWAVTFRR